MISLNINSVLNIRINMFKIILTVNDSLCMILLKMRNNEKLQNLKKKINIMSLNNSSDNQ